MRYEEIGELNYESVDIWSLLPPVTQEQQGREGWRRETWREFTAVSMVRMFLLESKILMLPRAC